MKERRWGRGVGIALLAIGCALAGCAGQGGGGGGGAPKPSCKPPKTGTTVSFANNIQPIFNRSCAVAASCHAGPGSADMDLTAGIAYGQIVNVPSTQQKNLKRINPGNPETSYLVRKIQGGPNISGTPMPQGCPASPLNGAQCLSADDIGAIVQWVTECATNN
jgi:hypothetical protein